MPTVIAAFGWASAAGFTLLGLLTLRQWRRERSTKFAILALALGMLALTSWLGRVVAALGQPNMYATAVEILAFELSGYFLLLFHGSFVTVRRRVKVTAALAIAVSLALFLTVRMPNPGVIPNAPQAVTIALLVAIWFGCVGEPTVRLWLVSTTRPTVQRARLRALAIGYGAIFIVLVVSAIPGTITTTIAIQVLLAALGLLVVPLLYMSFAPPRWLRRSWRHSEEETFRRGITDLLGFAPDATTLARRSLELGCSPGRRRRRHDDRRRQRDHRAAQPERRRGEHAAGRDRQHRALADRRARRPRSRERGGDPVALRGVTRGHSAPLGSVHADLRL
jgi:hypothetical protein